MLFSFTSPGTVCKVGDVNEEKGKQVVSREVSSSSQVGKVSTVEMLWPWKHRSQSCCERQSPGNEAVENLLHVSKLPPAGN